MGKPIDERAGSAMDCLSTAMLRLETAATHLRKSNITDAFAANKILQLHGIKRDIESVQQTLRGYFGIK